MDAIDSAAPSGVARFVIRFDDLRTYVLDAFLSVLVFSSLFLPYKTPPNTSRLSPFISSVTVVFHPILLLLKRAIAAAGLRLFGVAARNGEIVGVSSETFKFARFSPNDVAVGDVENAVAAFLLPKPFKAEPV